MTFMQEIGRNVGLVSQGYGQESLEMFLHLYAIQAGKTVYQQDIQGYLTDPDVADIVDLLVGLLPEVQLSKVQFPNLSGSHEDSRRGPQGLVLPVRLARTRNSSEAIGIWEDGFFLMLSGGGGWRRLKLFSLDPEQVTASMDALLPLFEEDGSKARMGVVVSTQQGMQIRHVGQAKSDLCRDNYAPEVLRVFDHLVAEIASPTPCGRLSILLGPPGTGKTYFIEGLTRAQPKARYILLPANLISALTGPELLMCLTGDLEDVPDDGSSRSSTLPIVFIVEDADECLVTRGTDNHPAISSLLNLADGILGRCLDVRIIATSNARKQDIDKALLRPGRICKVAHFDILSTEHSGAIFRRLVRDRPDFIGCGITQPSTLAEIYQASRQLEAPPERKPSVIGFAV